MLATEIDTKLLRLDLCLASLVYVVLSFILFVKDNGIFSFCAIEKMILILMENTKIVHEEVIPNLS